MWSTNFSPSKLTELSRHLPKFQFIKNQENCSNVQYLRKIERYNEGRPHFGILIRSSIFFFWCILCHLSIIENQIDDIQVVSQFTCLMGHPVVCREYKGPLHLFLELLLFIPFLDFWVRCLWFCNPW